MDPPIKAISSTLDAVCGRRIQMQTTFLLFGSNCDHNLDAMPSPDIYVQVTVTPHDRASGHPSDSPQTAIVEVPSARIKRYRDQSPYPDEATDKELAEYLAGEIGPHALARAGLHRSGRWCIDSVALPQRPRWIEARQSDFSYDGMKAWLPTRQSFV
jgi:hypothetical protein